VGSAEINRSFEGFCSLKETVLLDADLHKLKLVVFLDYYATKINLMIRMKF
jgi:hypothetical protein